MEDDLRSPLTNLTGASDRSIVSHLLELQALQARQERSFEWARELTCLSFIKSPAANANEYVRCSKSLVKSKVPITTGNYVAVSYRCDDSTGTYLVSDGESKAQRRCTVRDAVLKRISKYMKYHNVSYFWIDKESTDQHDADAIGQALQCMDLVYRCSDHPIGLLDVQIKTQHQLDLLLCLISGALTVPTRPKLARSVGYRTAQNVLTLSRHLVSDPWWKRRWIFQEEYCSDMVLLITHTGRLSKRNWDRASRSIKGEVLVNAALLRRRITAFCLACLRSGILKKDCEWITCKAVLEAAKSYHVLHKHVLHVTSQINHYRPMSVQILTDLAHRKVSRPADTLAILANCCGYSSLLDFSKLDAERCSSLSLAVLTMYLLNGEIVWSDGRCSSNVNLLEFLQAQAFNKFEPPVERGELTFMKKCRFANVRLVPEGVRTTGHLWRIRKRISTNNLELKLPINLPDEERESIYLQRLAQELARYHFPQLARRLQQYVNDRMPRHCASEGLEKVFHQTASCLASAVQAGENIIVVQSVQKASSWGIFVCNYPRVRTTRPSFIFTASEAAEFDVTVEKYRSPDKYVSLSVYSNNRTGDGLGLLSVKGWVNGLTFPGSAKEMAVVFRWPSVLREAIAAKRCRIAVEESGGKK